MKTCTVCHETKPLTSFFKNRRNNDGHAYHCKTCDNRRRTKHRKDNPVDHHRSQRNRNLLIRYGITIEDYERIFDSQGRTCGICKTEENYSAHVGPRKDWSFSVDHCHTTGTIRGLLCNDCNRALGLFRDSPTLLLAALEWLDTKSVA